MKLQSKPKRKSRSLMRFRFVRACVGWISRLMFWRENRPSGVTLGHYVMGDRDGLWIGHRNQVVLSLEQMRRHVLVLAETPEEKNRIASQLVDGVAREDPDAELFFLDSDGDPEMARLFGIAANKRKWRTLFFHKRKRRSLLFPDQPFNGWAGRDWRSIFSRLMAAFTFAKAGPASFYAETTKLILQLACRLEGRPPRSSGELLQRLDYKTLCTAFGGEALPGIDEKDVEDVAMRYRAVFAHLGDSFDGKRSFADLDSAYFSLYPLAWADATRMLLVQLLDYIQTEKDPDRLCVVFLRISAAVAGDRELALLLEQARACGVVVVPILQSLADAGSPAQLARFLGGVGTLIIDGDQARSGMATGIRLTESVAALSSYDDQSSSRGRQRASKVSPDDLLELPQGRVVVISNGKGVLVDVPPAS